MSTRAVLAGCAVVVLLVGVGAVVLRDDPDDPGPDQARLQVDGAASVTAVDGATRELVDEVEVLAFGEQVAMVSGSAELELADGSTYELRSRDDTATVLEVGAPPRVLAGELLAVGGFPAQVSVDTATLTAQGALRVDADDVVASAYAGRARVTGVGDVGELAGLRRLVLVAGGTPEPISFDGSDEWDRRYLGEAIAFGERLEALARGYTSDLPPGSGRSLSFFQSVLPALADERELGEDLLDPARTPGETLVGAAITVQGRQGTFRERWQEVFAFRAAGAAWGLVALDQGVSAAPVLDTIELAVDASDGAGMSPTTTRAGSPTATTPGVSTDTTTTRPTSTTTTTTPPAPPEGGLLDPVVGPTSEVLEGLLEVLGLAPP
ncbi:MAG TPA: hypothetical protein VLR27_13780 [Acidimicrobiales bacterium]|nr:hypothetical protein [Acidimicrobiales bacterium]